ncbi:conserved hypothetical protein (plasmid) [Borreliella afzelii PKo]|uniref:Uncharacterized protein n=2 Tax=Borreliella afzelii TaxID=29518 RepID=Q0SLH4_BORAP|nr:hypothetical protein BAPKO_3512 [Borreliella afzelii PKo]AEL70537.1 conserved hypothetical protein [Borreliella afzelii PKo]MBB5141626.1 hypothetical protein [Borreliella afzelii]
MCYKKALDILFTKIFVYEEEDIWINLETKNVINTKIKNLGATPTIWKGVENKIKFNLVDFSLKEIIPYPYFIDDEEYRKLINRVFYTLSNAMYEDIFKKATEEINIETNIKINNVSIDKNILNKIIKSAINFPIKPNQIIMYEKTANKIFQ